jgi:hypothetical protein
MRFVMVVMMIGMLRIARFLERCVIVTVGLAVVVHQQVRCVDRR